MNADQMWGRKCSMCKHFRYSRDPLLYVGTKTTADKQIPLERLCANRKENPIKPLEPHNFLRLDAICNPHGEIAPGCNEFDHPNMYKCDY